MLLQGVRSRYESTRDVSGTLEDLIRNESQEAQKQGTPCIVRLIRCVNHAPSFSSSFPPSMYIKRNIVFSIPINVLQTPSLCGSATQGLGFHLSRPSERAK